MNIFKFFARLFDSTPVAFMVDPVSFGWIQDPTWKNLLSYRQRVGNLTFYLYQSDADGRFVFDRDQKDAPGVIGRFSLPLLIEDLEYMKLVMARMTGT